MAILKRILLAICLTAAWTAASSVSAGALVVVPPGNRNATQPKLPASSIARTKETKGTFDAKYAKVLELLATDKTLINKIKTTAAAYEIDPIHMIGSIVGEHTYNVDAYDRLQTYYVQALSYAGDRFRFAYEGENISAFLERPEFEKCKEFADDSYTLWTCRENIWEKSFSGKTVGGKAFPRDRFSKIFFQPFFAGQTFGLGQGSPLMALMMSDLVAKTSGYPKLNENKAAEVYDAIMNPDKSLAYMAASIQRSIEDYKTIAGVDISKNPGITTTLYNVGHSSQRAKTLGRGGMPQENYFGWFVNSKLADLKKLLDDAPAAAAKTAVNTPDKAADLAAEKAATEKKNAALAAEKAASEKAAAEKAASEKAANEKAANEKTAAAEKAAAEKAAAEKAANEKAAAQKATVEKAAAQKAANDKASADKAAQEKSQKKAAASAPEKKAPSAAPAKAKSKPSSAKTPTPIPVKSASNDPKKSAIISGP